MMCDFTYFPQITNLPFKKVSTFYVCLRIGWLLSAHGWQLTVYHSKERVCMYIYGGAASRIMYNFNQ